MYFISYDLGTGGVKASLYDRDFTSLAKCFIEYPTYYPADGWHEQRPEDWWRSVCRSTHMLLSQTGVDNREIACVALSGQTDLPVISKRFLHHSAIFNAPLINEEGIVP